MRSVSAAIVFLAPIAAFGAFLLGACSSSSSTPVAAQAGCTTSIGGNISEGSTGGTCGALAATTDDGGAADTALTFQVTTPHIASLAISISLGPSPSPGSFSSENVTDWNVLGTSTASTTADDGGPGCFYSAGATVVPAGSFTLDITSIDPTSTVAHGTLNLTMYVHAASAVECGIGNTEDATITF